MGNSYEQDGEMVAKMVKNEKGEYTLERMPVDDNQVNNGGPKIVTYDADEDIQQEFPYLILDVRSAEEFKVNRIHRSEHFPLSNLNRDRISRSLLAFVGSLFVLNSAVLKP